MTILLVDSDPRWLHRGASSLRESGYQVVTASDGLAGLRQLVQHQFDAAVVDVPPSDTGGWDAVQRIRDVSRIPVIVVSARADEVFLKKGLDLGVHGYVVKPFEGSELVERLAAALRRTYDGNGSNGTLYEHDGLSIDWQGHEVRVEGKPVHLTATEFKLLSLLVARPGWVLTHEQILSHIWGSNHMRDKGNVKLCAWNLRQKIEADPKCPRRILAKRGIGYVFAG
jgi:two-component system KDP operon response regulator KdpE